MIYLWQQNLIETARGTFEYFKHGEGEPMAITHLYSEFDERGNAFANPFTTKFTVYLINLRGTVNSVRAQQDPEYSMVETVHDMEAIRKALHIEKWAFGGHSTGGMLALQYAVQAPNSITKLIAGGTAASYEYAMHKDCMYNHQNKNFHRVTEIMNLLSDQSTSKEDRQKLGYEWALFSYYSEDKLKEALKKPNSGKTVGPRLTYFRQVEYRDMDLREKLKDINIPSFIYAGRYDAQCPVNFGIEIAELIKNANLTIFEKSNHFPFLEEEEPFTELVNQFAGA